ncbi:MAG: gamma-glutamylcyclotransferase [Synergistaceae bacterium]|nr:gamma-glutamylcyclotransferase [Synergistaceae bacterium]
MKTAKTAKTEKTTTSKKSTKLNAAYGSNLSISQMAYRCPDAKIIGTGKINDYKLVFRYHADIEKSVGSYVPVLVWELTAADEKQLDRYEGVKGGYYHQEDVTVLMDDGKQKEVMVYIMNNQETPSLPSPEYFEIIAEGYERFNFDKKILKRALREAKEAEPR